MSWGPVAAAPGDTAVLWRSDDDSLPLLLVLSPGEERGGGSDAAASVVTAGLAASGRLMSFNGLPYLRAGRRWIPLTRVPAIRALLHEQMAIVVADPTAVPDPNLWTVGNRAGGFRDFLIDVPGLALVGRLPELYASVLAGEHGRSGIPEAAGVLRHPVHGQPRRAYLQDHPELPAAGTGWVHLPRLFGALDLPEHSHVAVYCFLLGAFSARSLDPEYQRPLLVVDSWEQGRGKTQVVESIQHIIDGREGVFSARPNSESFTKELVANFRTGRCLVLDNLDGLAEFSHEIVVGGVKVVNVRQLYDAGTFTVQGAMISLNGIIGAQTYHKDVIARAIRCEILGESGPLECPPDEYAAANRMAIIEEILRAHDGPAITLSRSRSSVFDAHALGAYCRVFGLAPERAAAALERSRRSMALYFPHVMQHLWDHHRERFRSAPHHRVVDTKLSAPVARARWASAPLDSRYNGATAFGLMLKDGSWEAV